MGLAGSKAGRAGTTVTPGLPGRGSWHFILCLPQARHSSNASHSDCLILTTVLRARYCSYFHFRDEETESQTGYATCLGSHSYEGQGWDSNGGSLVSGAVLSPLCRTVWPEWTHSASCLHLEDSLGFGVAGLQPQLCCFLALGLEQRTSLAQGSVSSRTEYRVALRLYEVTGS